MFFLKELLITKLKMLVIFSKMLIKYANLFTKNNSKDYECFEDSVLSIKMWIRC